MAWREKAPSDIVVVAVDVQSLNRLGMWPWPRAFHAEVLRLIKQNGAKTIGVDIGFFEPDRNFPENDAELAAATREAGNVIYPAIIERMVENGQTTLQLHQPFPELVEGAVGIGHAHIEQSSDGIVRKVHLAYETKEKNYWGLNLEVLRNYLDLGPDDIRRIAPGKIAVGPDIVIPVVEAPASAVAADNIIVTNYEMHIGYIGDSETFDYISVADLIDGKLPPNYFLGKIVLYGGNAQGLFDDHMTPFSMDRSPMPGVEIQANVINAMLRHRFITRAPLWMVGVMTMVLGLGVGFVFDRVDNRMASMLLIVLLAGALGFCFYTFSAYGFWVEVSPLYVAMLLSFVFALMIKMRQVNVALDQEVLNLSKAAALSEKAGEATIIQTFNASVPTLRDVLNVPAAALLKVDLKKGILIPKAQYGLVKLNANQTDGIKLSGDLTGLLISLEPIPIPSLNGHLLNALVPRNRWNVYHGLVVPLLGHGETVGAICMFRSHEEEFRMEEHDLFQAVSAELGNLWYNADLYERLTSKSTNPLAPFTHKTQERRIQTLNVLSDPVLSEKSLMGSIMDSIADGVIVTDVLGTIRLLNPKAKEILGLYAENAIGQSAVDFIRRFDDVAYEDMRVKFQKVVERGETFSAEVKLSLPTTRHYTLQLGPVRNRQGLVQGIVAVMSDITELKEMDQMKTDLMSMVTHEIRTPLRHRQGFRADPAQGWYFRRQGAGVPRDHQSPVEPARQSGQRLPRHHPHRIGPSGHYQGARRHGQASE